MVPEPNLQRQQSVLNLLNNFKGIDPLKKLFWSELNYDRVSKPLSRRGWKDNHAGLLADDPLLLASGASAGIRGGCTPIPEMLCSCRPPATAAWVEDRSIDRHLKPRN